MSWLLLTLLCALSLASADACTKKYLSRYSASELVIVRFTLSGLLLAPLLLVYPLPRVPLAFWGWVATAIPLEIAAMLLYMRAIRDNPLSATLPYLAFTPAISALGAWLLLGERISIAGSLGILLVIIGAYLIHVRRGQRWSAPIFAIANSRGARLMLPVALIYSLTAVLGKGALQYVPGITFGALYFVLIGITTTCVFPWRETTGVLTRGRAWQQWLAAFLMAFMVFTHFLALESVEVAYMIAVKRVSLLFGIVYGAVLFQEPGLARHLGAGALMLAGIALLSLQS